MYMCYTWRHPCGKKMNDFLHFHLLVLTFSKQKWPYQSGNGLSILAVAQTNNSSQHYYYSTHDLHYNIKSICRCTTTPCPEKGATLFSAITLPNPNRSSNSFTVTLSSKFEIKKSLNIPPPFTHVATLSCKTVVLKNCKLHCRPILKTFNDNEQLHNKIICSVNSHILA